MFKIIKALCQQGPQESKDSTAIRQALVELSADHPICPVKITVAPKPINPNRKSQTEQTRATRFGMKFTIMYLALAPGFRGAFV